MLQFIDFVPVLIQKGGFIEKRIVEPKSDMLERLNSWLRDHSGIEVVNVETVLSPGLQETAEERNESVRYTSETTGWYEIFRVWYREA